MKTFRKNTYFKRAQALLEVTILASLFIFLLSSIVRIGHSSAERHAFLITSFKDAINKASDSDVQEKELNYLGQYFSHIRVPDTASASGARDIQEVTANWSVQRSQWLSWAQNLNRSTMGRKHILLGDEEGTGLNYQDMANPVTGKKGFTTEGYRTGVPLPYYNDIPVFPYVYDRVTEDVYNPDGTVTEVTTDVLRREDPMYCLRFQVSDSYDILPTDGIYWSWVAVCANGWKTSGGLTWGSPPFHSENCTNCNEDYKFRSYFVADKDASPAHPAGSADMMTGKRAWNSDNIFVNAKFFFQSAYDPSVPLDSTGIAFDVCTAYQAGKTDDEQKHLCSWGRDDLESGLWIPFGYHLANTKGYMSLVPDAIKERPFVSRGMTVWLTFDELSSINFKEGEQIAIANAEELYYENCANPIVDTELDRKYCGANFRILALEAPYGKRDGHEGHFNNISVSQDEKDNNVYFGSLTGMALVHSVWGDINPKDASSRIAEQGIREYRIRSDVDMIKVRTEKKKGTNKTQTYTAVKLKDTITRTLKTNPFGELAGQQYDIVQEREVADGEKPVVMYNYEVQD